LNALEVFRITHIVNLSLEPNFFPERINYLRVCLGDAPEEPIARAFDSCLAFIDLALDSPDHRVLVHCMAGVSRSATIVIAYLMHRMKLTLEEAHVLVKTRRKCIHPNSGLPHCCYSLGSFSVF
jgi:protein-tyrosine phosphatase